MLKCLDALAGLPTSHFLNGAGWVGSGVAISWLTYRLVTDDCKTCIWTRYFASPFFIVDVLRCLAEHLEDIVDFNEAVLGYIYHSLTSGILTNLLVWWCYSCCLSMPPGCILTASTRETKRENWWRSLTELLLSCFIIQIYARNFCVEA